MARRIVAKILVAVLTVVAIPVIAVAVHATQGPNRFGSADLATFQTNGVAWTVAAANGLVFVGGEFSAIRPPASPAGGTDVPRANFAVFDAATGAPTDCAPRFELPSSPGSATVRSLSVSPDRKTLYVGGFFSSVSGVARHHIAALDIASCSVVPFHPYVNGMVRAIVATSSTVFYAGSFGSVGGHPRSRAAAATAVGTATPGALQEWAPVFDKDVRALGLRPDGSAIVAGGHFDTVNGEPSHALAVVSVTSGANVRTYPGVIDARSRVHDVAVDDSGFYTAHDGVGGGAFDGRIAFDWATYEQRWIDRCLGATQAVTVYAGILYSGSHAHNCEQMGSFPDGARWHFLAQSVNSPTLLPWFPNTDEGIGEQIGPRDLAVATSGAGDFLWAVGEFTTVNGKPQQGITRFGQTSASNAPPSMPAASVNSPARGQARVTWRQSLDTDDAALTYRVYRDDATKPVYSTTGTSWFWLRPQLAFTDVGLVPGSVHRYRVEVSDGQHTKTTSNRSVTVADGGSTYADRVLADGASFLWRYDDAADVLVTDSGGYNNSGTVRGVVQRVKPGALGGDPSGAITLAGHPTTIFSERRFQPTAFTEETWFKTTTQAGGKLIGFGNNQTIPSAPYDKHIYMTDSGRLVFGVYVTGVGTVVVSSSTSYNDGAWHHVAAAQGPAGMALYVDGVKVAANAETRNESYPGYVRVGGDNLNHWPDAPTSHHFAGALDETAYYETALSAATIADHHRLGAKGAGGGGGGGGDTTPPTAPTAVSATVSGSTVAVTWAAASDNLGVSAYDVYRSATSGFTPSPDTLVGSSPGTTFTNTSVAPGTWYYRVVARDAAGNRSAASDQASTVVRATVASRAPANLKIVRRSEHEMQLTFDPVPNATLYRAYVSATSGSGYLLWSSGFTTIPVTLSALPGSWYVVVTAMVDGAESPYSNEVYTGATPPRIDTDAPSTPRGVAATVFGSSISLGWPPSSDDVGVAGYDVHRSTTSGFAPSTTTLVGTVSGTTFAERGVAAGTWYYRVVARDAAGNRSAPSAPATAAVATKGPAGPVVLVPLADAHADEAAPATTFGTAATLVQRRTPATISYLRFAVPQPPAGKTLARAVLRVRTAADPAAGSTDYHLVQLANNGWDESSLSWAQRPAMTAPAFGYLFAPAADTPYESQVHPLFLRGVAGGGDVTFAITSLGSDVLSLVSREGHAAGRPQLILTYG